MRHKALLLPALAGCWLAILAPGPAYAADDPAAEEELAQRYAPVMVMVDQPEACGPGDPYAPVAVDPLLGDSSVALRGPWTGRDLVAVAPTADDLAGGLDGYSLDLPGNPLKPGCDYETWADRLWGTRPDPVVYAHVATQRGVSDRIALQFYFYYPFNDFNNKHESDWERIQLEFPAPDARAALDVEPDLAVYSQHYGSERSGWDDDKLTRDGEHPLVFVSSGSHASQFGEGLYLGTSATEGFGCDTTVGPHLELRPEVRVLPSDPEVAITEVPWLGYRGHWGELGPQRFYEAPTGPNMKEAWTRPFTWSALARESSFSLPGAEAAGNEASSSFCGLVSTGSDAFRRFSADPLPVLAVLVALLAAIGLALRRTGWSKARPLPLVATRSAGQVVSAGLRLMRSRPRLFLLLASPAALVSAAATVLSIVAPAVSTGATALLGAVSVLLVLAVAWAQLATTQAIVDVDSGRPVSLRSLVAATRSRAPALLVTVLLWAVVLLPLLLTGLLAPVALVLLFAWSLTLPVVQVEGLSGPAALRRSWHLVRRQPVVVLVVLALSVLVVSLLGGVVSTLVFVATGAPFAVVSGVPQLVTALVWPFAAVLTTYAWANGRSLEGAPVAQAPDRLTR